MSDTLATTLLAVLSAVVLAGLPLTARLYRLLRTRHPATFEALGSPSLPWNNTPRHGWLLAKFLFGTGWRAIGDPTVVKLCRFMRVYYIVTLVLFLGAIPFLLARAS